MSPDKVFSVDGANAARNLIRKEGGRGWNDHRIQLVWDAIALHTYIEVSKYKEAEVVLTSAGTYTELFGPASGQQVFVRTPFYPLTFHRTVLFGNNISGEPRVI